MLDARKNVKFVPKDDFSEKFFYNLLNSLK